MITFALAEDDEQHSSLIKQALKQLAETTLLIDAVDGYALLTKLNNAKKLPDILLLDINLPKIDGLLLTIYISRKYPSIKIIGISSHCNKELVTEVLSEGAISFISKHFTSKTSAIYQAIFGKRNILFEAINDTLAGKQYTDTMLFNEVDQLTLSKSTKKIIEEKFPLLTNTQIKFLILNAADLSYKEIALSMNKSRASVKGYYNTLALQFKVNNRTELSCFCIKNGLVKLPAFYDKTAN
ncbi:MAG: response regulator transcription factor [Sediminibacterium sp.]|nr:response regulator transcription factor [Sediminibacterium sp.]MDP3128170.1 response regulator transcription factor [Sediminibacterium sp.]